VYWLVNKRKYASCFVAAAGYESGSPIHIKLDQQDLQDQKLLQRVLQLAIL